MVEEIPLESVVWKTELLLQFKVHYQKKYDTLQLRLEPARQAVNVDVAGEFWLRVDPETKEIVGVEIEDFTRGFLVRYPAFAPLWDELRPRWYPRPWRNQQIAATIRRVGDFIKGITTQQPHQLPLLPAAQ
jgi:hypothetical protein